MNVDRPEMPIPQGAKDALSLAQLGAGQSKMAGYDQAMSNIDRTLGTMNSSAGRVSTGSGQALEALTNASAIGMGQKTALDIQNAQDMERRREILRSELGHMAQWQKDKWAWDYQQKYLEDAATKSALIGSGIQNTAGALQGAGQVWAADIMYKDLLETLGSSGGGNGMNSLLMGMAASKAMTPPASTMFDGMVKNAVAPTPPPPPPSWGDQVPYNHSPMDVTVPMGIAPRTTGLTGTGSATPTGEIPLPYQTGGFRMPPYFNPWR